MLSFTSIRSTLCLSATSTPMVSVFCLDALPYMFSVFFMHKFNLLVHLLMCATDATSERSCQVYRNECRSDGTGTVHVVVGTAGAGLEVQGFSSTFGDWSLAHIRDWGYLRMFATDASIKLQVSASFHASSSVSVYFIWTNRRLLKLCKVRVD